MLNLLTDELPKIVLIDGHAHEIRWQYHIMIKVEQALHDPEFGDSDRIFHALMIFYDYKLPEDLSAALREMRAFMAYDKPLNRIQQREVERRKNEHSTFSFEHDDELIYAAFMQQYGINLTREKELHWYEFRALLGGLDECPFTRVRGWRGTDLSKIKDAKERARMAEQKERCALPLPADEQAAMGEIEEILKRGGDLSAYMRGCEDG